MKVFSNKREKMCVFSKVGELLWLFFFYTLFIYSISPLKEKYIFP